MNTADVVVILAAVVPLLGVVINNLSNRKSVNAKITQDNIGGEKTAYGMYMDLLQKFNAMQAQVDSLQNQLNNRAHEVLIKNAQINELTERVAKLENILKSNHITF